MGLKCFEDYLYAQNISRSDVPTYWYIHRYEQNYPFEVLTVPRNAYWDFWKSPAIWCQAAAAAAAAEPQPQFGVRYWPFWFKKTLRCDAVHFLCIIFYKIDFTSPRVLNFVSENTLLSSILWLRTYHWKLNIWNFFVIEFFCFIEFYVNLKTLLWW